MPVPRLAVLCGVLVALATCTRNQGPGPGDDTPPPEGTGDCGDADPLTNAGWAGFCEDRVDDNCTDDAPQDPCPANDDNGAAGEHHHCRTHDEPCPATQPASGPPQWDCTGAAPANVLASAHFTAANQQVTTFCAFVYESLAVAGEFYVAIDITSGPQPQGPDRLCSADFGARRYLYFSDLDDGPCDDVRYIHAYPNESPDNLYYPVDLQKLSTGCHKAIRNITRNDPAFEPDIQYFAASREEALAKLAVLDTAEIACLGIDNLAGDPYRAGEVWVSQASAPLVLVP